MILETINALINDLLPSCASFYLLISMLGKLVIHDACLFNVLKGAKILTSSGYSLCEVCTYKVSKSIPSCPFLLDGCDCNMATMSIEN